MRLFWFLLRVTYGTVDVVFCGSRECNPIPRFIRCDVEIWLTLPVIQPGVHSFNIMMIRFYSTQLVATIDTTKYTVENDITKKERKRKKKQMRRRIYIHKNAELNLSQMAIYPKIT